MIIEFEPECRQASIEVMRAEGYAPGTGFSDEAD